MNETETNYRVHRYADVCASALRTAGFKPDMLQGSEVQLYLTFPTAIVEFRVSYDPATSLYHVLVQRTLGAVSGSYEETFVHEREVVAYVKGVQFALS